MFATTAPRHRSRTAPCGGRGYTMPVVREMPPQPLAGAGTGAW